MSFVKPVSIPEETVSDGRVFPLTFAPASQDFKSSAELVGYLRSHKESILQQALSHGAVLLRGFDVSTPEAFAEVGEALHLEKFPYIGGAAPRYDECFMV